MRHHRRGELRHAMSEVLPNEVRLRKRSQTMANVKEHAYGRLQEELSKAQEVKKDSAEDNNRIAQAKREKYQIISNHRTHAVKGPYVFITVIGVLINTPLFIASLLQAFFAVNIGKCISSLGSIIAIYACSYILTKRYKSFWRSLKLTTNEHILILASSGMMAVFMLDLLMALASPNSVTMFASSRVVCMLEIYLQTYFLIKIKRYRTNGQSCIIISSSAILLMITNLVC